MSSPTTTAPGTRSPPRPPSLSLSICHNTPPRDRYLLLSNPGATHATNHVPDMQPAAELNPSSVSTWPSAQSRHGGATFHATWRGCSRGARGVRSKVAMPKRREAQAPRKESEPHTPQSARKTIRNVQLLAVAIGKMWQMVDGIPEQPGGLRDVFSGGVDVSSRSGPSHTDVLFK